MNPGLPIFLSCDWGTSSFRIRSISTDTGTVLDAYEDSEGIQHTYRKWQQSTLPETERERFFLEVLLEKVCKISPAKRSDTVIISGMASSAIGLRELPYATPPFITDGSSVRYSELHVQDLRIILVSGFATDNDVMRGEEIMLLGLSSDFSGMVIQPGTHSKHISVDLGEIRHFDTFMTGEVFDLLLNHSILSNSIKKPGRIDINHPDFESGIRKGFEGDFLKNIFKVRTRTLLNKKSPESNYHFLSGLVLGDELRGINSEVHLIAGSGMAGLYEKALSLKPVTCRLLDADMLLIKGHMRLFEQINSTR